MNLKCKKAFNATVSEIVNVNKDTKIVLLSTSVPVDFIPGQHVFLKLPSGDSRPFSIANKPNRKYLELHIKHKYTSKFIRELNPILNVGQAFSLEGPCGQLLYRSPLADRSIFITYGMSITPIKSILESVIAKNIQQQLFLYWLGEHLFDLYMNDYFIDLENNNKNFSYKPIYSASSFNHELQRVLRKDHNIVTGYDTYICGNKKMVANTITTINRLGGSTQQCITENQ
jgi:NAD(P)H-flavin reductase